MKTYVVGNWKMNFTVGESSIYLQKLLTKMNNYRDIEVVVAPSMIALQPLSLQVDRHKMKLAAQNANSHDFGPYTGEVSFSQIRSLVKYCLIGHSERRYQFCETDKDVRAKVAAALRNNIVPIICIGETALEKAEGATATVLRDQLRAALQDVPLEELSKIILAYEPVWAISGHKGAKEAKPSDVEDAVKVIRKYLARTYGEQIVEQSGQQAGEQSEIPLLYGGSINPDNAAAYLNIEGVNGLLVGGASLISSQFLAIIETAKRAKMNGK